MKRHLAWIIACMLAPSLVLAQAAAPRPGAGAQAAPAGSTLLPAPILAPQAPVSARAPYAPDALSTTSNAGTPSAPSVVLDKARAQALAAAQAPRFITTIDVSGSAEADAAAAPKTFEQRFSDALTAPPYVRSFTYRGSTEPCTSLASPGTPFGPAFNLYGFCP